MARGHLAALIAGLVAFACLATSVASAEDVSPPIREFDVRTIEELGQHMYRQDQEAWKATDILLAKHSPEELRAAKAHGWIVDAGADRDLVRFIREGATGPEVAYDVTFVPNAEPVLSEPKDRSLSPEELAQLSARRLALKVFDFRCSNTPPNTVAFKDGGGKNWLVWAMSATTDQNLIVVGGHIRFTISADGKSITQKDRLSNSCLVFNRSEIGSGFVGIFWNHVVSLLPVETELFASLSYKMDFRVGAPDGRTWKLSDGHMTVVEPDAADPDGYIARMFLGRSEVCSPIIAISGDSKHGFRVGSAMKITERLEREDGIALDAPPGDRVASVVCARWDIVPLPNDYKLLLSGYPLYITDAGEGHPKRTGVLEMVDGRIQFRINEGEALTDELNARLQKRLDALQNAVQAKH